MFSDFEQFSYVDIGLNYLTAPRVVFPCGLGQGNILRFEGACAAATKFPAPSGIRPQPRVFRLQFFDPIFEQGGGRSWYCPGTTTPDGGQAVANYAARYGRGVKRPNISCRLRAPITCFFLVIANMSK